MQMHSNYHDLLIAAKQADKALVIWRDKEGSLQHLTGFAKEVHPSELSVPAYVFRPFFQKDNTCIAISESFNKNDYQLPPTQVSGQSSKIDYLNAVQLATEAFDDSFKKVVLARNQQTKLSKAFDAIAFFAAVAEKNPNAYCYFVHFPCGEQWVGASPELLLKAESDTFSTQALAGTVWYDNNFGAKEKAEQGLVTEYIQNLLLQNGAEHVTVSALQTTQSGHLRHLVHQFTFKATSRQIQDIMAWAEKLHPTPAVCGMPKETALNFISRYEKLDRSMYAGYSGFVAPNQANFYVNLRCVKISGDLATLYAGAGILKNSIAEIEFQETVNKMAVVGEILIAMAY